MNDEELILVVSDIQNGNIREATRIINMFSELIYRNSYIDGRLNEDCIQELIIKLIACILNFKFEAETNILTFL